MRVRKLLVLLLGLVLLLAACSGGSGNPSSGTQETVESETNSGTENETSKEPGETENSGGEEEEVYRTPEMDFDLGGKTIKVVSWWDMTNQERNPDEIAKRRIWMRSWRSIISKSNISPSTSANTKRKLRLPC